MNYRAIMAIYQFEMARTKRTLMQSIAAPVVSTILYFIVFGSALGGQMTQIDGVPYGAFIVPGLIMLTIMTQGVSNTAFGIYMPRFIGTMYQLLSAPISPLEIVIGYVAAGATKSMILALLILFTSQFFVSFEVLHPFWMLGFLLLTAVTFALFGFIIGVWADSFEKLQVVPLMVITPLTFLGGCFYSIHILPDFWQKVVMFNPVVYLLSGFRWSFYGSADVSIQVCLAFTFGFMCLCLAGVWWIFKTGYRIKV